jgi:hypothetical protein
MKLGENKIGLIAADFKGKHKAAEIASDVKQETKKSKKGVDYEVYSFEVNIDGKKHTLTNLMRNQLNNLVDYFGDDTASWIGKTFYIDAEQKGDFHNFVFYGDSEIKQETV